MTSGAGPYTQDELERVAKEDKMVPDTIMCASECRFHEPAMQTYSLTLSERELSYTILALQKYRQSLLESEDDEFGDELGDLLVLDSALKKLRKSREEK